MSEQESRDSAQVETDPPAEYTVNKTKTKPESQKAAGKGSSVVAWLALLLVTALALGAAWIVREGQHREEVLAQRLATLESADGNEQARLDAVSDRWQRGLESGLEKLETALGEKTAGIERRLDERESQLDHLQEELSRFSVTDRNSWLLAEARHLLRLASQRLVMARDPEAALALMGGADAVLLEIDDSALHEVRAAVAADTAALRALPRVDTEGIYLRIAALVEQADELMIFEMPAQPDESAPALAEDWKDRLRQGYKAALAKLSNYIIIRRRDVPMQALMDPQWEALVRQNLRMLLEQAQVALLSGNQSLYVESLKRARHWVDQFSESDASASRAMAQEIAELSDLVVGVELPELTRSLQAMDAAIESRGQTRGGE